MSASRSGWGIADFLEGGLVDWRRRNNWTDMTSGDWSWSEMIAQFLCVVDIFLGVQEGEPHHDCDHCQPQKAIGSFCLGTQLQLGTCIQSWHWGFNVFLFMLFSTPCIFHGLVSSHNPPPLNAVKVDPGILLIGVCVFLLFFEMFGCIIFSCTNKTILDHWGLKWPGLGVNSTSWPRPCGVGYCFQVRSGNRWTSLGGCR